MNIRQMKYIIAVANEGGVTEAAKKLYISQPSLSHTIHMIEKEVGTPLFNRHTHPFQLTYAGRRFVEMATSILNCQNDFFNDIKDHNNGYISIGIAPKRSKQIIPYILPEFIKQFPKIEISLYEDTLRQLIELLLGNKIDIALVNHLEPFYPELVYIKLFSENLLLIVAKNSPLDKYLAEKYLSPMITPVPLTEVKDEKFILIHRNHNVREAIDRMFAERNISPNVFLETHDSDLVRQLVAENVGVAIVPQVYPYSKISSTNPKLSYFFIDTKHAARSFALAYKKDTYLTKWHKEFIAICIKILRDNTKHNKLKSR